MAPTEPTTTVPTSSTTTTASTTTTVPPCSAGAVSTIAVDGPGPVVAAFSNIWVGTANSTVVRVEPGSSIPAAPITTGGGFSGFPVVDLASDATNVLAVTRSNYFDAIDPATDLTTGRLVPGFNPNAVVSDGTNLWVAVSSLSAASPPFGPTGQSAVLKTSVGSGGALGVLATVPVPGVAVDVVAANGSIWVATFSSVERIDPTTGAVIASIPASAKVLASDGSSIWAGGGSGLVSKIDPSTNSVVASVRVGPAGFGPQAMAVVGSRLWTAPAAFVDPTTGGPSTSTGLVAVDRASTSVERTISLPAQVGGPAWDGSYLWSSMTSRNEVTKVETC